MKCEEIIYETVPYCCGELGEEKAKEFKRHITICRECARFYFRIRKTLNYLRDNAPENKSVELISEIQTDR
jgi:hypothetical protein